LPFPAAGVADCDVLAGPLIRFLLVTTVSLASFVGQLRRVQVATGLRAGHLMTKWSEGIAAE
jgi:hypothetical protein